jgi:hypothetical protein
VAGQNLQIAPHIGWANAMPGAEADVQLNVHGEELSFTGLGYHDKVYTLSSRGLLNTNTR